VARGGCSESSRPVIGRNRARIREMIEALQEEELALHNIGADPANFCC
jgi:hypothetical protein